VIAWQLPGPWKTVDYVFIMLRVHNERLSSSQCPSTFAVLSGTAVALRHCATQRVTISSLEATRKLAACQAVTPPGALHKLEDLLLVCPGLH
jgi:hypothetical protein